MFGVILTTIGGLFEEASTAIGKFEVSKQSESIYTMAFLSMFWGAFFFLGIGLLRHSLFFSLASLPIFLTRAVFEAIQVHVSTRAAVQADRSTYAFVRTITIPLLLVVDLFLGYTFGQNQIIGITLIIGVFIILCLNKGIRKEGMFLTVFSAVNAVITISFFKYNITYFKNSVEAEQALMSALLLAYFFGADIIRARENPLRMLLKPIFFAQSATQGIAAVLFGFAFLFAPPSVIIAAGRSSSIVWSVVSGNRIFKEDHIVLKTVLLMLCVAGIIFLAV
ncbi:MAG: hypothetical protein HYW88_00585 [Candidatus Sungbacteria bacterium]|nr:hypothetical protein [Candidatus Sungbacteria bacterium]